MKREEKGVKTSGSHFNLITIILAVVMLIIPITFFLLLDQQTGAGFGVSEILFSIVFAIVVTLFLAWVKSFMRTRPYLGLIIGLIALAAFGYSLFFKYLGPYAATFAVITIIIVLIYLGIFFFKYKKLNLKPESEIDSI